MRPEAKLSQEVRRALALKGCRVWSTEAPRVRGPSGSSPGVPDLIVFAPGRFHGSMGRFAFAELKTPTGHLSHAQQDFQTVARTHGVDCLVWRSVDDALQWLDGC